MLEIITNEHNEYVSRAGLVQTAAEASEAKQSPSASKAQSKRGSHQRQQKQQTQPSLDQTPQVPIPESMVNDTGTTRAVLQFLEVSTQHKNLL